MLAALVAAIDVAAFARREGFAGMDEPTVHALASAATIEIGSSGGPRSRTDRVKACYAAYLHYGGFKKFINFQLGFIIGFRAKTAWFSGDKNDQWEIRNDL